MYPVTSLTKLFVHKPHLALEPCAHDESSRCLHQTVNEAMNATEPSSQIS